MTQPQLFLLIPSCKPHFAPAVLSSILYAEPHQWAIRACFLQQGSDRDPKGMVKINQALDWLPDDAWTQSPSDDAIHNRSIYRRLGEIVANNPELRAVVFSEHRGPKEGNRILHAHPDNLKPGLVDGSMLFARKDFIGDLRYPWDEHQGEADGHFIMRLYQKGPERFFFCDEPLLNFNSLET